MDHSPAGARGPLTLLLLTPLALWTLIMVALPPSAQDFPLNDDWAYAKGAFAFARGKGIHYFGWASMPLLGQWLWAWPFLQTLGETHVTLRLSTIVLASLGVFGFFDLLRREAGLAARPAAVVAAALALNPLFFLLSGTYLSDVPALSLSIAALALYHRGFDAVGRRAMPWLVAASAAATLAVLTRQNALAAPAAAGLALVLRYRTALRVLPLLSVAIPAGLGLAAAAWFGSRPDVIPVSPQAPDPVESLLLAFATVHFLGLAALPVLVSTPLRASWKAWAFGALSLAAAAAWLAGGELYPYLGNMLTPWGAFGAPWLVVGERPVLLGGTARLVLTVAGCLAGGWLLATAARRLGGRLGLLSLYTFTHAALLLISPQHFDRYLIVLLPGALLAAAGDAGTRVHGKPAALALAVFAAVSVGLMHDWLAWNSARWTLGRRAVERGIPATDIEGGFEWDGWHSPRAASRKHAPSQRGLMLRFTGGWFPRITGRWALAFSQPSGTVRQDAEPYRLWLPPRRGEFLLLTQEPTP